MGLAGAQFLQQQQPGPYKLRQPSIGQQMDGVYGRQPSPALGHGLVHTIVAGDDFRFPQYSCISSQRPSLLSPPQLPQLLQSHVGTQAPNGWQCASGTQYWSASQVVVSHGLGSGEQSEPAIVNPDGHLHVAMPSTNSHDAQRPQVLPWQLSSCTHVTPDA